VLLMCFLNSDTSLAVFPQNSQYYRGNMDEFYGIAARISMNFMVLPQEYGWILWYSQWILWISRYYHGSGL